MATYDPNMFSRFHNAGHVDSAVQYLNTIQFFSEQDIHDILIKMMRCSDRNCWNIPVLQIILNKYTNQVPILNVIRSVALEYALEQIGH